MGMIFRISILSITHFCFYVATTKAQCGPGDICELHEWVEWDCKYCCKMNTLPNSAVQKRKICCQGGAKTLTDCLSFCNINISKVERWGPCASHCYGKCTNGFHFATTETHITSEKKTHTKETKTTYTSVSPTTTQQTTIAVSMVRTSNPMTSSFFRTQNIQSTSDKIGTTEFEETTPTTKSIQTTTELEMSVVSFTGEQYVNDTVTSDGNRNNVSNPTDGINATTENAPNTTIEGLQRTKGKCYSKVYFPILLFVAGFLVGGLLTTTVFCLKKKKTQRINVRRSNKRIRHQIALNYANDGTPLNGVNKSVKRDMENLAF